MTDDEVVGWHHRLDGYEFKQTPESWWWTRKPDVLQSTGSKRVGHDWQLNWTDLKEDTEKVNFGVINDDFKVHIKKKKKEKWPWYNLNKKSKAVIYSNILNWKQTWAHSCKLMKCCNKSPWAQHPASVFISCQPTFICFPLYHWFPPFIFFKWWKYRRWGRINVKLILVWFLGVRGEAERGRVWFFRNSNYYYPYVYIFKNFLTMDCHF